MRSTRISHVTDYNAFMDINRKFHMMFTVATGAMHEELRVRGWVLWQSPLKGDAHDFAKYYPNKQQAELNLKEMV